MTSAGATNSGATTRSPRTIPDGDLDVVSFLPETALTTHRAEDLFGNPMTSTTMPTNMIADTGHRGRHARATLTVSVDQSSVKAGDQTVTLTSASR